MSPEFWWILGSGLLMSAIALVGSVTAFLPRRVLDRLILPLVALAAGSMLGGALFHMIPEAVTALGNGLEIYLFLAIGFLTFFCLEQFLHWHHCHRGLDAPHRTFGTLLLLADGVHNFVGGLAVAGAFLIDIRVGIATWLAAAAHEVPQELGDFGALVHSGWSRGHALLLNFLCGLSFPAGALLAWALSHAVDVRFLLPFAAGNFLYIAAADLIPEVNRHPQWRQAVVHFLCFTTGLALLLAARLAVA